MGDNPDIPCGRRESGDDFFCIRFRIWYPSIDCAFRTRFATSPACSRCDQGRFNLKRHASALRGARFLSPGALEDGIADEA